MRRQIAAGCAFAAALLLGVTAPASLAEDEPAPTAPPETTPADTTTTEPETDVGDHVLRQIVQARRETWRWERLMGIPRTPSTAAAEWSDSREHRLLILKAWRQKAAQRRKQAWSPPRLRAWLCIHRHERHPRMGWRTRTGNGFYGGLQMDLSFQRTYAAELLRRKGTADKWSAIEQIWVAERAYRSGRGFTPWPNTGRSCGLL